MAGKRKLVKYMLLLSITFLAVVLMVFNVYLNKINYVKIPQDNENLGIKNEEVQKNSGDNNLLAKEDTKKEDSKKEEEENQGVRKYDFKGQTLNIVLLGGDKRQKNDVSHADSIIVLSVDPTHKKIKISSIMRDTYLNVYGCGKTKVAHAYIYGGPGLTIRTLNENFGLKIKDYIFIDFFGFEKVVDLVGGIEIDIKQYEIREINKYIREVASLTKTRPKLLKSSGTQILNGQQALAYCRIRKAGNGDFERTERQRRVLDCIIRKINESGPLKYPFITASMLPHVETSLSKTEILQLGMYILTSDINTVEQQRFPMDGYCRGKIINKVWYLVPDLQATKRQMHKFIYEDN